MKINIFDGTELVVHVRDSVQEWRNRDLKKKSKDELILKVICTKWKLNKMKKNLLPAKERCLKVIERF